MPGDTSTGKQLAFDEGDLVDISRRWMAVEVVVDVRGEVPDSGIDRQIV
ncbi:MAG TPA: hypothetical protein VE078_05770 [Thermoanaerobaculia bacterium]|nr:hypothetical protein [Thermoanaerobaculia bacterium]